MFPSAVGLLLSCIAAALLAGCVSGAVRPDAGAVAAVTQPYIVPMETPPLVIDSVYTSSGSASIVHFLPRYSIGMARTVGVLSGIAVLLELPGMLEEREVTYAEAVKSRIEPAETWLPTLVFAHEAAKLLNAPARSPAIVTDLQPIPGIRTRGRTVLMENWLAPVRAWYNDDATAPRYAVEAAQGASSVLEIGISNYSIFSGKLVLQVHVKLIEAGSGRFLGRARSSSFTELEPMDALFAGNAEAFKSRVTRAGGALVADCLRELGLITH
jgi:hypothetical protein